MDYIIFPPFDPPEGFPDQEQLDMEDEAMREDQGMEAAEEED